MSGESCSECDGYETVIVDGEEVHCATCSLRAEIKRLWAAVERLRAELDVERTANRITENHNHFDCAAELSRLRCENERVAGGPS